MGEEDKEGSNYNISGKEQTPHLENNKRLGYNSGESLEDLKRYIQDLEGEEKREGEELVKTLEKETIQPGYLAKFRNLIKNNSWVLNTVTDIVLTIITSI